MCPYCKAYVHGGYGLSGTCGLDHEAICEGARKSREVEPPPPSLKNDPAVMLFKGVFREPIYDTGPIEPSRKKKAVKPRLKKRGRSKGKKKERARR